MAWLAVNKNKEEIIYYGKPERNNIDGFWYDFHFIDSGIPLPKGTIKKLINKDLTWEDEPVEIC